MNEFFTLLKKDHKEVKMILEQLDETKGDAKKREALFQKLTEELIPHMKAEESVFYPVLIEKKETREAAMEGAEEHHVSEMVFKELQKLPKGEDEWGAKIAVFKELVEHHIKEEEGVIFKEAEKALPEDKLQTIMEQFEKEKSKVKDKLQSPKRQSVKASKGMPSKAVPMSAQSSTKGGKTVL